MFLFCQYMFLFISTFLFFILTLHASFVVWTSAWLVPITNFVNLVSRYISTYSIIFDKKSHLSVYNYLLTTFFIGSEFRTLLEFDASAGNHKTCLPRFYSSTSCAPLFPTHVADVTLLLECTGKVCNLACDSKN